MTSATGTNSLWGVIGMFHIPATAAWHIQNGSYDSTDVGGLNVVG
jgi:hypothetical protein